MKRASTIRMLAAVVAATLIAVPHAGAQRRGGAGRPAAAPAPRTRAAQKLAKEPYQGLLFGAYLLAAPGVSITDNDDNQFASSMGPGVGVTIGYGFNRTFSAFASLDVARQPSAIPEVEGSLGLSHGEIGVRANLSTQNPLMIPYVTVSLGRRAFGGRFVDEEDDEEYDLVYSGSMLALGGGIERALSRNTALHGAVSLGFGSFTTVNDDGEDYSIDVNSSTSLRFRVGLTWRP
jgi:hypothetical protein